MSDDFKHLEDGRYYLGKLYLEWKAKYGDQLSITFIDPRNTSMIVSYLLKHMKKGHISISDVLKHLLFHVKLNAIFVNGYYLEKPDNFDKIIEEYKKV